MSHTTTVDSVVITDVDSLRATIRELKENGIKCELLENALPRAYYPTQAGMDTNAPFVVQLQDSPYDVGLYQNPNGNGYVARTDLFMGKVERVLGLPANGGSSEAAAIGKLLQTYAKNATVRKAVQQGYRVSHTTLANGTVQLTLSEAA